MSRLGSIHRPAIERFAEKIPAEKVLPQGGGPSALHAKKTSCPAGHPYGGANLYTHPANGQRFCREAIYTEGEPIVDMTDSIAPRSDQINADDLMGGPRTYTITEVTPGNAEQPVNVELADSRPFRPSKSMLRVMVTAWGLDGKAWVGHRVTLFRDPKVKWAGQEVGGLRISHMTGIDKPLKLALTETRGKRTPFTVQPLTEAPAPAPAPDNGAGALGPAFTAASIAQPDRLAWVCKVIGRDVTSPAQLTTDEVQQVLDSLTDDADAQEQIPGWEA